MTITDISIIFVSIILEAIPFLILGVLLSSLIQEFVSEDTLKRLIPKNPFLGSIVGILMGFFIPTCDCAVIPVARRLLKKNVPLNVCISFMLASPIVNPVSILSTVYAFEKVMPQMIFYRVGFGILAAFLTGILISFISKKRNIVTNGDADNNFCGCGGEYQKSDSHFWNIIWNSKEEFLGIMKYLIIGSLITTIMQFIMNTTSLNLIVNNKIIQIIVMMLFAYIISLCSTADAFVGRTFLNQVSNNSILAFLLLGPMIDLKNTLVLSDNFEKKFVIKLLALLSIIILIITSLVKI